MDWQWFQSNNRHLTMTCHFSILKVRFAFWAFSSKTGNTRVTHRVKMMTRWPGRERWPKWPIDPVAQWPSSMSAVRLSLRPSVTSRLCRNDWANLANFQHGGFLPPIPHCVQENLDISNNYDTSFWNFVSNRSGLKNFATASRSRTRRRRRPSSLTTPIRQSTSHGHGCLLQVDQL